MVLNIPPDKWNKLSYKERRRLISKEKKRISRISVAKQRQLEQKEFEEYIKTDCGLQEQELAEKERQKEEAKRQLRHEEWLERERKAQEDFRQKKEKEDTKLKEREERERIIREEWEEIERREREAEERKKGPSKQSKDHNTLLEEALAGIDQTLESMDKTKDEGIMPWHNPFAPVDQHSIHGSSASNGGRIYEATVLEETQDPVRNYGTEKDKVNCPFYLKTGACRYGDTCSRHHPVPDSSATLIIRSMYSHQALSQQYPDDQDAALEIDEGDLTQDYNEFYNDVLPELAECGKVIQFKVSRNFEAHLRGNVYVQFSSEKECSAAVKVFNGRWYAGKQLTCQFSPVQRWRTAICGLYNRQQCPKGKHCNFLHVFDNPEGAFSLDTDNWHSPRRGNDRRHTSSSSRRRDSVSPDRWRGGGGNRGQRTDRRRSRSPVRRYDGRSRRRESSPSRRYHSRKDRSYSRSRSPKRRIRDRSRSRSYSPARRKSSSGKRERRESCSGGGSSEGSDSHKKSRHKKNKKKKSKHRHKKEQHKQSRQNSDDDSSNNGEVDQRMVDQVLRNVIVD